MLSLSCPTYLHTSVCLLTSPYSRSTSHPALVTGQGACSVHKFSVNQGQWSPAFITNSFKRLRMDFTSSSVSLQPEVLLATQVIIFWIVLKNNIKHLYYELLGTNYEILWGFFSLATRCQQSVIF